MIRSQDVMAGLGLGSGMAYASMLTADWLARRRERRRRRAPATDGAGTCTDSRLSRHVRDLLDSVEQGFAQLTPEEAAETEDLARNTADWIRRELPDLPDAALTSVLATAAILGQHFVKNTDEELRLTTYIGRLMGVCRELTSLERETAP